MKISKITISLFILIIMLGTVGIVYGPKFYNTWQSKKTEQLFIDTYSKQKDFWLIYKVIQENREMIKKNSKNDSAYNSLAQGLYTLGDYDGAINAMDRAIAIKPDNDAYWFFLGKSHQAKKDYTSASNAYAKAIEFPPARINEYLTLAWLYYFRLQDEKDASYAVLKRGLQQFPQDKDLLWEITRYYIYARNAEQVKIYAPQYLALDPANVLVKNAMQEIKDTGALK